MRGRGERSRIDKKRGPKPNVNTEIDRYILEEIRERMPVMRKIQKDSIIELVNLLKEAQEHTGRLLSQREYASVLDLLGQS